MFEHQTYDAIMVRLLAAVPENLDKREGSFIWDALSPAALELAQAYVELDIAHQQTYVVDASGGNLDKRAGDMGVTRLPASKAVGVVEFTGTTGTEIPSGSLVTTETGLQYQTDSIATIGESGKAVVSVTAVEGGVSGNVPANTITTIPISIPGVTSVNNPQPTFKGEDKETDDAYRERYFKNINNQSIDGNVAQYKKWAGEYPGIGCSKVFPLWNGPNTVKISILDAQNQVASEGLLADFQKYMDPGPEGLGNGAAPIGSKVTVTTATGVAINISAELVLTDGYSDASGSNEALTEYLRELAYTKTIVSYIGIGAAILDVPSIDQVRSLLINGATADITLTAEQVPVLGTTTWTVVSA